MDNFVTRASQTNYWFLTVGNSKIPIVQSQLFTPRRFWLDSQSGEKVKTAEGFYKSVPMDECSCYENTVWKWASVNAQFSRLDQKNRATVNKLKSFLNSEKLNCLVILNEQNCTDSFGAESFSYGYHFHVLVSSTTIHQLSSDSVYRKIYRDFVSTPGGYCKLLKVNGSVNGVLKYMYSDPKKHFMGSTCSHLLDLYNNAEAEVSLTRSSFELTTADTGTGFETSAFIDVNDGEEAAPNSRLALPTTSSDGKRELIESLISTDTCPNPCVPMGLKNDRASKQVTFLLGLLKKFPEVQSLTSLVTKFQEGSDEWNAIIAICASSSGTKLFALAQEQCIDIMSSQSPMDTIRAMDDKVFTKTLSVRHSIALFIKWCEHQGINPRYFFCLLYVLLSGQGNKKVGLYLQGQSNSGKTYMTAGLFRHLSKVCGHITTDNFPFQDCGGKKIIIGEEVAITQATANLWKKLMSGVKVSVDRKLKGPAFCEPQLVVLSSNVPLKHNLTQVDAVPLANRLHQFGNLRTAPFLKDILHSLNPKLFINVEPPSEDEEFAINHGEELPHSRLHLLSEPTTDLMFDTHLSELDDNVEQPIASSDNGFSPFLPHDVATPDSGADAIRKKLDFSPSPEVERIVSKSPDFTALTDGYTIGEDLSTPIEQTMKSCQKKPTRPRQGEYDLPDTVQHMVPTAPLKKRPRLSIRSLLQRSCSTDTPSGWTRQPQRALGTFYRAFIPDKKALRLEVDYYPTKDGPEYTEEMRAFWEEKCFIDIKTEREVDSLHPGDLQFCLKAGSHFTDRTEISGCLNGEAVMTLSVPMLMQHRGQKIRAFTFDLSQFLILEDDAAEGQVFKINLPKHMPAISPCVRAHWASDYSLAIVFFYLCVLQDMDPAKDKLCYIKATENSEGLIYLQRQNQEHAAMDIDHVDGMGKSIFRTFVKALTAAREQLDSFIKLYNESSNDVLLATLKFLRQIFQETLDKQEASS